MYIFSLCHTGFGLNPNILETNILNLAVVYYLLTPLKSAYEEVLEKRTKRIMDAIAYAQLKYEQRQAALKKAKFEYVAAKYHAFRIRSRGRIFVKKYSIFFFKNYHERQIRNQRKQYNKDTLLIRLAVFTLLEFFESRVSTDLPTRIRKLLDNPEKNHLLILGCLKRFAFSQKIRKGRRLVKKFILPSMF
jgi:hypothetical protein